MYLATIALSEIRPPEFPARAQLDEVSLDELTDDVRRNGVLVPPHVKIVPGGYEITAGHRRYLAACAARIETIRCLVLEAGDPTEDTVKLTENLFRQELSPVEEAAFFAELYERGGRDVDVVCTRVGKSRLYVEARLLLLSGDSEVLVALSRKAITLGVAAELNKIEDTAARHYYLGWAVSEGATVKLVRFWRESSNAQKTALALTDPPPVPAPCPPEPKPEPYQCFICGESEPIWDLQVNHIHRACKAIVERSAVKEA